MVAGKFEVRKFQPYDMVLAWRRVRVKLADAASQNRTLWNQQFTFLLDVGFDAGGDRITDSGRFGVDSVSETDGQSQSGGEGSFHHGPSRTVRDFCRFIETDAGPCGELAAVAELNDIPALLPGQLGHDELGALRDQQVLRTEPHTRV